MEEINLYVGIFPYRYKIIFEWHYYYSDQVRIKTAEKNRFYFEDSNLLYNDGG